VGTVRQVIEAAAGAKLGRRYCPAWPGRRAEGHYRRQGRDLTDATMIALMMLMMAFLAWSKPPLPGWLPRSVLASLTSIEGL